MNEQLPIVKASRIEIFKELLPGPKSLLLLALVVGLICLKIFCLPKDVEPVVFVPDEMKQQRVWLIEQECQNAIYVIRDKWEVGHNTFDYETKPDIAEDLEICLNEAGFVTKKPLIGNTITVIMKPKSVFDLIRGLFK